MRKKTMSKRSRIPVPQIDVLEWLQKNHPELHAKAVIERSWIWLAEVNLSGEENKEKREAIKDFGFIFKNPQRGAHVLPDGRKSNWAHHCEAPIPFKRGGGKKDGARKPSEPRREHEPHALDAQLGSEIDRALRELNLA
jgi:hypothetical protein